MGPYVARNGYGVHRTVFGVNVVTVVHVVMLPVPTSWFSFPEVAFIMVAVKNIHS